MFDITEYLNAPFAEPCRVVERGGREFSIRRLNGAERLQFNDFTTQYARVRFALSRGLLSGADGRSIGEENATKLLERNGALAESLFNEIYDLTERSLEEESRLWEDEKKKSPENATTTTTS